VIPSGEELADLFASGRLERIGIGSRRACFRVPGGAYCVKGYRSEEEIALGRHVGLVPGKSKPLGAAVVREIRRCRFSDRGNTSCQEWRYYEALRRRLPAELMAVFPGTLERVLVPGRGWCLVEEMVLNADGTPVQNLFKVFRGTADPARRAALLRALDDLQAQLERHAVRFYDPQNVMVQELADGGFRLRVVDFEPASRTLLAVDRLGAWVVRLKVRRRFRRFRRIFHLDVPAAAEGGR